MAFYNTGQPSAPSLSDLGPSDLFISELTDKFLDMHIQVFSLLGESMLAHKVHSITPCCFSGFQQWVPAEWAQKEERHLWSKQEVGKHLMEAIFTTFY